MWRRIWGFTLVEVLLVVAGVLIVTTVVIYGSTCSGTCTAVACSESAPCTINGTTYTIGSACAAGIAGTVCEDNWFPFADCYCRDSIGQGNVPRPVCVK